MPDSNAGLNVRLRLGVQVDLSALNAIALAAKAYWEYPDRQIEAWRGELEVSPNSLRAKPVFVAESGGRPVGFVQVATDASPWELWALWVHPTHMRHGVGRALLFHASRFAAASGQREILIDADPNAEGFYTACGAKVDGYVPAPIPGHPGRVRPRLMLSTTAI